MRDRTGPPGAALVPWLDGARDSTGYRAAAHSIDGGAGKQYPAKSFGAFGLNINFCNALRVAPGTTRRAVCRCQRPRASTPASLRWWPSVGGPDFSPALAPMARVILSSLALGLPPHDRPPDHPQQHPREPRQRPTERAASPGPWQPQGRFRRRRQRGPWGLRHRGAPDPISNDGPAY